MIQNHIWKKYPFKDRLMNFTVLRFKRFIDMDSDSTFLRNYHVKLEYSIKKSYNYLK